VVISQAIVDELSHPGHPKSGVCLALVAGVPRLPVGDEVREVVRHDIAHQIMPQDPVGGALHLALASCHKCDYLLTWNCNHIANPNEFRAIRIANAALGLYVPALVTPNQLIGARHG